MKSTNIFLGIIFYMLMFHVHAQEVFRPLEQSKMTIAGTSSLHDWESDVSQIDGTARINITSGNKLTIENLSVSIPVTSIKSGKSSMDKNTYEALKEKSHPEITFLMTDYTLNNGNQIQARGKLTIAGVTKDVNINATYQMVDEDKINFTGTVPIDMTDYNIDPPTAVFGTIKTGKDVTLQYDILFSSNK